jgi:hypothetical protein
MFLDCSLGFQKLCITLHNKEQPMYNRIHSGSMAQQRLSRRQVYGKPDKEAVKKSGHMMQNRVVIPQRNDFNVS